MNAVMQLNDTILEAINRVQVQGHVTVTPRQQWDPLPDENGGHTNDELVDRPRVKKRGDDLAAAHQPDILARPLAKTAHEWADCIVHELQRLTERLPVADDVKRQCVDSVTFRCFVTRPIRAHRTRALGDRTSFDWCPS